MPNTDPPCDTAAVARSVMERGRAAGLAAVLPAGALTKGREGRTLAAIGEMAAVGVRLFTDDGNGVQDARLLRRAMEYLKAFGAVCAQHCEEESLSAGGHMNEGEISSLLGLRGVPAEAEEIMLARDLALARMTGARYHAQHLSTAGSVALVRAAKAAGASVTAEATPHHAVLTDAELVSYDPVFKINPPLRTSADVEAVRMGLADGTIDAIATDHAPHAAQEKEAEFELAPPGTTGLETALSVVLTELVEPGILTLSEAVARMSLNPARILGLSGQGGPVVPGAPANLVVFDPGSSWTVEGPRHSRSGNSVWRGRTLKGRVIHTVFEGRLVVADEKLVEAAMP